MPLDSQPVRIAGSRPKKKAASRQHKDNVYARIEETKFNRYIVHDLARYRTYIAEGGAEIYSEQELNELEAAGVSDRLPPRATGYYLNLAKRSEAVKNLIKARPEEMDDLSGEADLAAGLQGLDHLGRQRAAGRVVVADQPGGLGRRTARPHQRHRL